MTAPLRVLTISELFPDPARPAFGIFVAQQVDQLRGATEHVVLVPSRVFPPLSVFRDPRRTPERFRRWLGAMLQLPPRADAYGAKVLYARYTSPPRQLVHGSWGLFAYAWLRRTLRALHREHRFDLVHAHYAVPSGVVALLARRWMGVPVVLSVHGTDLTFTAKQDPLSAAIVRAVFERADAILANSTWAAEQIMALGGPRDAVEVVHLGADPPPELRRTPLPDGAPLRILSIGRLVSSKGHAFVLAALGSLRAEGRAFRYTIVGGGPELHRLQALAARLGLSDVVRFVGTRPHAEVWSFYADADVFVLPSWIEAFGIVYIEALAAGVPVIACEETGIADLKRFGDCLELVKPQDAGDLTEALRRLFTDPERRRVLGDRGRAIVREHYSWRNNAAQTLAAYERVLAKRGARTS